MARIKRSDEPGNAGLKDVPQGLFREQLAALSDMLRQIAGNAVVLPGNGGPMDPLSAPFALYVNPYTGSDKFIGGSYNTHEATGSDEEIIAQKLKRVELQRLECGYTPQRPFKTINRACIEAAIITSKTWYTYTDPRAHVDCVTIVLSGGVHIVYTAAGSSSTSLASWGTSKDPTPDDLTLFNPATGGLLMPRGCSLRGQDLRKTALRPSWVPPFADELADYSNRRAILKVSGTGFFFDYTFMDKIGHAESVHLLDPFQPASKAELDAFYTKVQSAVGNGANLSNALLVTRPSEYEIVGPIDQSQAPSSAWDTTAGASPYIFNVSVRSEYGMGGAFWDGAKLSGLKSMVCANFTGTNQQKDMRCWQVYENGAWVTLTNTPQDYQKYINADPDNVRRHPTRQTRHISAINNAYIQKVSIFGIGQGEVTMVDSGGEITDNGGNSTFGGCSALAKGYKNFASNKDKNWVVSRIRVPLNISEKTSNIRRIQLGFVASVSGSTITLLSGLALGDSTTNPAVLESLGYSFASSTRIWIENPDGADWSTTLSASAWSSSSPANIGITGAPLQSGTNVPAGDDALGCRVYLRRLVDTRTVAERRCSLVLSNTTSARLPQRNTVLQTDPNRSNGAISRLLAAGGEEVLLVTNAGTGPAAGSGVTRTAEVSVRRGAASRNYAAGQFYRQGTVVKHADKHWQAIQDLTSSGANPDPALWGETYVHMPSDFNPEDSVNQEAPIIVLDTDTSDADNSTTLGITWATAWSSDVAIRNQYRTGTDYLGVYAFLRALGFSDAAAHAALVPHDAGNRDRDPSNALAFPTPPAGGAAAGLGNWAVEFRRPSTIRLYNHQWEWAGFGNYSKAMPAAQQDMSDFNKFTYYFTSSAGGRVVPKGSNEDGFEVTPKGLEDIATGATISPESLGGQTLDEAQRTDFPNGIQVSGTALFTGEVSFEGETEFGSQSQAKTTKAGAVELAGITDLQSTAAAATNVDIDNDSDNVVTIKGLNYWKNRNKLVSALAGVQYVYVNPFTGEGGGRNITSIDALLSEPPITQSGNDTSTARRSVAVRSLRAAVNYANQVFGPTTTVEFRCGPGVYLDTGTITFSTIAILRAWDFGNNTYLNDSKAGGTKPFMGQSTTGKTWESGQTSSYFLNSTNHPAFLSRPRVNFVRSPSEIHYVTEPLILRFNESGTVIGIVWWGVMQTIISSAVPDTFFPGPATVSDWRSSAQSDPANALNIFIKAQVDNTDSSERFSEFGIEIYNMLPCIEANDAITVYNVAFGAMCPAVPRTSGRAVNGLIRTATDGSLADMRGVWLIGNVNISSQLSGGLKLRGQTTYQITGHSPFVFFTDRNDVLGTGIISIRLGGFREVTGGGNLTEADYNFTWNNIHLVNNSLQYPSTANDANPSSNPGDTTPPASPGSQWQNIGPAFQSFISRCSGLRTSNNFWHFAFLNITANPTLSQGFAGKFGNYNVFNNLSLNARTKGIELIQSGFNLLGLARHYILRAAGTVSEPSNTGYPPPPGNQGVVGADENFDALNAMVTPVAKGIDITNVTIISQNAKL